VVERNRARGRVYGLRFSAYGERRFLTLPDGTTRAQAEEELANVLADVRRGMWRPDAPPPVEPEGDPGFHRFASEWLAAVSPGLADKTRARYRWQLTHHVLPFFKDYPLRAIGVEAVDRYREQKVREGRLSADTINGTLTRLGQILDVADERGLIDRNPLRVNPRRRKLKASKPRTVWLDRAEQIEALLSAAAELDREARADRGHVGRRAMLATMVFGGLRIGEVCALRWRDVDLAGRRINVASSKTDAGRRYVDMLPPLRDALVAHKPADARSATFVFPTGKGNARTINNVRERIFNRAVERANDNLERDNLALLPEGLTPHKLRHTFASLLIAVGEDPACVMGQLGHTDPAFTLRLYTHAMHRGDLESQRLRKLIGDIRDLGPYLGQLESVARTEGRT
jgi:integrase